MRWIGRFCLRMARAMASLPCSMASSRRSLENQARILLRARGDLTKPSQSRDGPGAGRLGGEDLHQVAVVEGRFERDEPPVDPRSYGPVADLGVHGVREVDRAWRRRAAL